MLTYPLVLFTLLWSCVQIMVLRQEMERADERIETVDYRIVERVAEIDESFDTFDARVSILFESLYAC